MPSVKIRKSEKIFDCGHEKIWVYHQAFSIAWSIFPLFFQISPTCFAFCQLCFDFWSKTADSGCLCSATLQKLPDFLFEKIITKRQKSKQNGDIWKNIGKMLRAIALHCCANKHPFSTFCLCILFNVGEC